MDDSQKKSIDFDLIYCKIKSKFKWGLKWIMLLQ